MKRTEELPPASSNVNGYHEPVNIQSYRKLYQKGKPKVVIGSIIYALTVLVLVFLVAFLLSSIYMSDRRHMEYQAKKAIETTNAATMGR